MPRIDIVSSQLHNLLVPVLPHAPTDEKSPAILRQVRLEVDGGVAYAVATDRHTLAAERLLLLDVPGDVVIYLDAKQAGATLKLFPFSRDEDPELQIVIDKVRKPTGRKNVTALGLGMTIESEDGTKVTLHDSHEIGTDPLSAWRKTLAAALFRKLEPASPSLLLTADIFGRWVKATRGAERLTMLAGPGPTDPILILVEAHFAAVWKPAGQLEAGQPDLLTRSPWRGELGSPKEPPKEPAA